MRCHCTLTAQAIVSNFTFDTCYDFLSSPSDQEEGLPPDKLRPLVDAAIADYACASLLLRLPGAIPIPAFDTTVPFPSSAWVDRTAHAFVPSIDALLSAPPPRVVEMPLIARKPSTDVHDPARRSALLAQLGVPSHQHDPERTRIVRVSFGGQAIPRPRSRPPSPNPSRATEFEEMAATLVESTPMARAATEGHLYAPGAPPAALNHATEPPPQLLDVQHVGMLPPGWIAIVAGMSGSTSTANGNDLAADLPPNFYIATQDAYVPDLTALADVVLGKLVRWRTARRG